MRKAFAGLTVATAMVLGPATAALAAPAPQACHKRPNHSMHGTGHAHRTVPDRNHQAHKSIPDHCGAPTH